MDPFASEHDAQADNEAPPLQRSARSIRRKPIPRDDSNESVQSHRVLTPITENRQSPDINQTLASPRRPSLRDTVSSDSLQVEARTDHGGDVSSLEDHDDDRQGGPLERPVTQEPRPLSQAGLEVVPDRTQDDARPPENVPKARQHGFKEHAKAWAPEFGWILLALALFIALIVVLRVYDNKGLPDWPMGLTLNTLVAFLATMCRSIIIIPIGEGLSQLKWNWFVAKKRPIKDLYIFDQASRGPWGSIRLICRMKGRLMPLSYLASIILIAGLVTSFLTQSTIAYSDRLVDGDVPVVAIAKKALSYPTNEGRVDSSTSQDVVDALERNAFQAAFLNVDNTWPEAQPHCSGANCTWPVFSSLGVCATLSNITEHLRVEDTRDEFRNDAMNVSLPLKNGTAYLIENVDESSTSLQPIVNMTSPETLDFMAQIDVTEMTMEELEDGSIIADAYKWPPERESLGDWGNSDLLKATFSQFFFIYANNNASPDSGERYRAAELLWHFCVYDYEVSVESGKHNTKTINVETRVTDIKKATDVSTRVTDTKRADEDVDTNTFWLANKDGNETFPVREKWGYTRLDPDFRRAFTGAHSTRWGTDAEYSEFNRQFGLNLYQGINSNMSVQSVDEKMWDNLGRLSWNIAQSATTFMRDEEVTGEVIGETPVHETFITVRWEWLAFLAAQITLALIFLLAIIFHTAILDIDIVKSSNISELFATRGAEDADRPPNETGAAEDSNLLGIKSKLNKTVQGQLIREGMRWRLDVGRERPPDVKYQ